MRKLSANDFRIGMPHGWSDQSTITLVGPPQELFTPNVQVHRELYPQGISAADYLRQQRADLGRQLDSYQLIKEEEALVGGRPALQQQVRWRLNDGPLAGTLIRQHQVAVAHEGVLYTVTMSAMDEQWASVEAEFGRILDAWEFIAPS